MIVLLVSNIIISCHTYLFSQTYMWCVKKGLTVNTRDFAKLMLYGTVQLSRILKTYHWRKNSIGKLVVAFKSGRAILSST